MTTLAELKRTMAEMDATRERWDTSREEDGFAAFAHARTLYIAALEDLAPALIAVAEAAKDYLEMQTDFRTSKVVGDYAELEGCLRAALARPEEE